MIGFLAFTAVFGLALWWAQTHFWYERINGIGALTVAGVATPVEDYQGVDATSSPLKLRGCFKADPDAFAAAEPAPDATPLTAPDWFDCYDAGTLTEDLAGGRARAYALTRDDPDGFDLMAAIYPDGRGYLWRQLGAQYRER
jgi:hypothetical protein